MNTPVGHPTPFPPQNYMNSVVVGFFFKSIMDFGFILGTDITELSNT